MTRLQKYLKMDVNDELNQIFEGTLDDLQNIDLNEVHDDSSAPQERIDEEAISATLIVSTILALPSLLKTIIKTFGFFYKKIKKLFGGKEESNVEQKLVELSDKWHHAYIKVLRQLLKTGGVFKSAGIEDKDKQMKATEVVFYTIIFGFAIHGGLATAKGIMKIAAHPTNLLHIKHATLEGVLTSIKSKEVRSFIQKMMKA
ncbi:hypothetical protein AKJ59_00280 [candidate division MSBL1 archaeon SCGC-AAA385M02]|uniref:Uncharacterized protein n=1 Tax=candidate division MSBL1 archaeon SCGC-AAA385M02 TaxID=1698287 RepID=A0A133VRA1_9EURY|nr:hypothetical protein AKJ59_00280 [candidate division MSBL1 archaeon SCGC-AAA385M02]